MRVNDLTTQWTYRDVIEVVEGAGTLDCLMLPKVQDPAQVVWLDTLLTQIEGRTGFRSAGSASRPRSRTPRGLVNVDAIAGASPRLETLVFGPADFMASINMRTLVVGEQPPGYTEGDAYHYILMRILMAARIHDLQAIDGPYLQIKDLDGYRRVAGRAAALGFDGKWVLHPSQVEAANEVFSPVAGRLRPRRADPRRVRVLHDGREARRGHARRRDDRRGVPEDGPGRGGQGPGRRAGRAPAPSPRTQT